MREHAQALRAETGAEPPGDRPEQAASGVREQEFRPRHLRGAGDDAVQVTQHDHEAGGGQSNGHTIRRRVDTRGLRHGRNARQQDAEALGHRRVSQNGIA